MNVNVKLGQKVWFFRYDGDEDDFEIFEAEVGRININTMTEGFETVCDWCEPNCFVELNNGWAFDLKTEDNENFFVKNDGYNSYIFFGFTKEEAEEKAEAIKKLESIAEEEKELEEFKRLQEKFKDRI